MAKQKKSTKILLTGGGTAGHLFPLVDIAEKILKLDPEAQLLYVGCWPDVQSEYIQNAKLKTRVILSGKIRRYFSWSNFFDLFRVLLGFFQSIWIIFRFKPDVILAKGGFVAVPIILASNFFKVRLVSHESDVVSGLANKLAARKASVIACGFDPKNYVDLPQKKLFYTGTPVRQDFIDQASRSPEKNLVIGKKKLSSELPILLVTGGSQGAHRINELLLPSLNNLLHRMIIIHICGRGDYNWLESESGKLLEKYRRRYYLYSFIGREMARVVQRADLVVARAGANTLAELAVMRKAAIVIPLSTSANNHQWHNAKVFERAQAIALFDERELGPADLEEKINELIGDPGERKRLAENIARLAEPEAAERLARIVISQANL